MTALTNEELFARGLRVIPGGVNSPVRAFRSVGGTPYFVARGEGAYVWDVEGTKFIDYVQSYGASILGHADPRVIAAIQSAASAGTTFGAPTPGEVALAELLCNRVPGMEQVRLVSSGTEATMSAIRLARGATGRARIVKFAGNYHGHSDALLVAGGSGVADQGLVGSEGVTAGAVADTVVAPYNLVPELDETVAVVCVEPVAANMGLVEPEPGFLRGLRDACDRVGALLLFDEVITGFRLEAGGATTWSGVQPDLWCFGKVIGGGLPVGAFGASAEVDFRVIFAPTVNDAAQAEFVPGVCAEVAGEDNVNRNPNLIVASEDFSFMLEKVPGCYFNIGNGAGEGACEVHNPSYDFNDAALALGASVFARIVETRLARAS